MLLLICVLQKVMKLYFKKYKGIRGHYNNLVFFFGILEGYKNSTRWKTVTFISNSILKP